MPERRERAREPGALAVAEASLGPSGTPDLCGYRLAARSSAGRRASGDTLDVLPLEDGLLVTVADVSGTGLDAALIAASLRAEVRLLSSRSRGLVDLAGLLNRHLVRITAENRFATFAAVRLGRDGTLSAVNAGHCPLLVRRRGGGIEAIASTGVPLGLLGGASYRETGSRLAPGELVLLYTDGLTEAAGAAGLELGVDGVAAVLAALPAADAMAACAAVLRALDAHMGGLPLADDATMLAVERLDGGAAA